MTYGITLQNDLDETITEYSDVLYEKETGVTIDPPAYSADGYTGPNTVYFKQWARPEYLVGTSNVYFQQVASSGRLVYVGYNGSNGVAFRNWIGNDKFTLRDLAFVQPKSNGIWGSLSSPYYPPYAANLELQFGVASWPDKQLNYKIASTDLPGGLSGNYGMQIRKANGQVCFDSRAKMISLVGHFYISQADFAAVLDSAAVRTFTIPTPAANAYLCIPYYTAFKFTGSGSVYVPVLKQVDDVTFMITRGVVPEIAPGRIPGIGGVGAGYYVHDATVMVAQDI